MSQATLRDLVVAYSSSSAPVMDDLMKASPIVRSGLAIPASNNIYHKYKKLKALPTVSVTNLDGSITPQSSDFTIEQSDISYFAAQQNEPAAIVENYPGGIESYFMNERPGFIESFGQTLSKQMVYGNDSTFGNPSGFKGLHQIAKDSGNVVKQFGGTSGSRTSIFAVKWKPSTFAMFINPVLASQDQFVRIRVLNGGEPSMVVTNTSTGAQQLCYQAYYDMYLGLFSASSYDVAALTQIQDATGKKPTASYMDQLVDEVKGTADSTVIYCSRLGRRLLGELKDSKLSTYVSDNEYNTVVELWNGIPVVIDENIRDDETTALD